MMHMVYVFLVHKICSVMQVMSFRLFTSVNFHLCYFSGLIRLQEVLKATEGDNYKVTVRKLDPSVSTYVTLFKSLKEKREYRIVVDCHVSKVQDILHEVHNVKRFRV